MGIPIPLKIAGDGPLLETLRELARDMPWVEICGGRSRAEVYDLMGRARALLFPSLMTAFPDTLARVVIEAYARGAPVLASDTSSASGLVLQSGTGLVFRNADGKDLAQQVLWMWGHAEECAGMGRRARQQYELEYTGERSYRLLMDTY
jgi:glycosyltransferase involved in cell wall biosynthesis